MLEATGEDKFYYLQDHLGSPIRLLGDKENDTPLAYDEFGVPVIGMGGNSGNPFGFTGYQVDYVSGLYYAQARYYEPKVARFGAEDPIGNGVNWYTYCENNPVVFIDPLGLADGPANQDANQRAAAVLYNDSTLTPKTTNYWEQDNASDGLGLHQGVDLVSGTKSTVDLHSITAGTVVYAKNDHPKADGSGTYSLLIVKTNDPTNIQKSVYVRYLHLNILESLEKDKVLSMGDLIGTESNLGTVNLHTHIEITYSSLLNAAPNWIGNTITTLDPTKFFDIWMPFINDNPATGGDGC